MFPRLYTPASTQGIDGLGVGCKGWTGHSTRMIDIKKNEENQVLQSIILSSEEQHEAYFTIFHHHLDSTSLTPLRTPLQ